ncbi:MAG: phage terminase large subunit [Dehalococcoidia bacterium]|nr:phage terminase large subunit [Dehalococcoidia bacterium]
MSDPAGTLRRRVGRLASEAKANGGPCSACQAAQEAAQRGEPDRTERCPVCRTLRPWARAAARESLIEFTSLVKPKYRPAAVHVALAAALERVERGEVPKLVVTFPPRHGKSTLVSETSPPWLLGRNPDRRVMMTSYTARLARGFGRRARNITQSTEYQAIFPGVTVADDSSAADEWNIEGRDGGYLAAGVGGSITGQGADVLLIDDPIRNRRDADSLVYRDAAWDWYSDVASTRLEGLGAVILCNTRWHQDDLAGRLLEAEPGEWEELRVPAIAEAGDPLGREVGEALWPARFPLSRLEKIRSSSVDFDALYQGMPTSRGGATFRREWFDGLRFDADDRGHVNRCAGRWISVDTAMKESVTSDYTSAVVVELMPDYRLAVRETYRERLAFPDLPSTIEAMARRHNRDLKLRGVLIEDKGSGISALQTLRASAPGWLAGLLIPFEPGGSKEYRAAQAAVWTRNGCVLLPAPSEGVPWLADFEAELFGFPSVAHDDQVDSLVQVLLYLENFLSEGFRARAAAYEARDVVPISASKQVIDRLASVRAG